MRKECAVSVLEMLLTTTFCILAEEQQNQESKTGKEAGSVLLRNPPLLH